VNVWDLAAHWSARRWLRKLRSRLEAGRVAAAHDPEISAALGRHVEVIRTQLRAESSRRSDRVPAPYLVLLALYADGLERDAVRAGWEVPLVWSARDGLSLRLLACCELAGASRRNGRARR
jgi:hypothetical protein